MIYKARITKNTDIERRRISENYKIAKQPCWVPNIRYGARACWKCPWWFYLYHGNFQPRARFLKLPIITGPLGCFVFHSTETGVSTGLKIVPVKLSAKETKWNSLDVRTHSTFLETLISKQAWFRARQVTGSFEKRAPAPPYIEYWYLTWLFSNFIVLQYFYFYSYNDRTWKKYNTPFLYQFFFLIYALWIISGTILFFFRLSTYPLSLVCELHLSCPLNPDNTDPNPLSSPGVTGFLLLLFSF